MSFNKITIIGYLGGDPDLRYTPQGTAVCKFNVATTEKRKDTHGDQQEHTTWFRVTVWGRQGEVAKEYLAKGKQVYVEGRLRIEEYTSREGEQKYSVEVNATDVHFLSGGGQQGQSADSNQRGAAPRSSKSPPQGRGAAGGGSRQSAPVSAAQEDDDIPF